MRMTNKLRLPDVIVDAVAAMGATGSPAVYRLAISARSAADKLNGCRKRLSAPTDVSAINILAVGGQGISLALQSPAVPAWVRT